MTAFLVKDEFLKRLKPIEHDVVQHALCVAMLTATGHASADELTDGWVTPLMLKRALAAWSPQRRRHVAAQLVWLEIWDVAEGGGFQFRHWDLEQPSSQDTVAAREKWAAHKRAQRAKKASESSGFLPKKVGPFSPPPETRIANDFAACTSNVHPLVHGGVHPPSPSLPSPAAPCVRPPTTGDSPSESPAASAGPPPKPKLKGPKKATASGTHKSLIATVYGEAFEAAHGVPASATNWATVQLIATWASRMPDPEAAIRASCAGYFESWVGKKCQHAMHHWAKNPAGYYAEQQERAPSEPVDPFYVVDGPDGLSPFDRQFIVRRTA
jgi:hypothetical protein